MLAQAALIGFIPVTDFALAESFFSGCLGLPVVGRDPFALVLSAGYGIMIRCVQAGDFKPQPFTILGWEVPDLRAAAAGLIAAGIEPLRFSWFEQDAQGLWTAPGGDQVVWFKDPFGNTLSLSQHAAGTAP